MTREYALKMNATGTIVSPTQSPELVDAWRRLPPSPRFSIVSREVGDWQEE